jgi:hypothetical protein
MGFFLWNIFCKIKRTAKYGIIRHTIAKDSRRTMRIHFSYVIKNVKSMCLWVENKHLERLIKEYRNSEIFFFLISCTSVIFACTWLKIIESRDPSHLVLIELQACPTINGTVPDDIKHSTDEHNSRRMCSIY